MGEQMTDKEKLIFLLKEFGIGFDDVCNDVTCEQGMNKVSGYSCFFTRFEFDTNGKFIEMGAWE